MLSVVNHHIAMTDVVAENQLPPPEEVLEDGEIDDEEEVVTEEVLEETASDSQGKQDGTAEEYTHSVIRTESYKENDDDYESDDDKKKSHKKHQRKRKKHRDSREKELKKRRKRKMHSHDDNPEASHEHGGSLSPHSRRRKKRKKHSRDRKDRDSTTPESEDSVEQYPSNYYTSSRNGYGDEYGTEGDMYSSNMTGTYNMNNSSSAYYATTMDASGAYQGDSNNYGSESGSDFEAQLAEYQNYKTHGDTYSKDSNDGERKKGKKSSTDADLSNQAVTGEMYEEFMEYDENPKRPCKFFAEGKCLKGNECSFSHDQTSRQQRGKSRKKEMCKYFLAGHCHHGNQCTYMHGEYPCKYFHTGATCYAGDKCRFSHDPPTEETKEIIESFKDALSNVDDSWEVSELKKLGIEVRPKPPPGVGLLPTPDFPPMTSEQSTSGGSGGIPSLFDISVAPSAAFQKRIDENSVASLSMTDESEGTSEPGMNQLPPTMYKPPILGMGVNMNGAGLLPTPPMLPNPNLMAEQAQQSQESDGFYDNFYEGERMMESSDNQGDSGGRSKEKSDDDVIKTDDEFIRIDNSTTTDEERNEEAPVKAPDFLPATQKALFMRIHGKRNASDSDKDASKKNSKGKNRDDWMYSSDEDEKPQADAGVIKMDTDAPVSVSEMPSSSTAAMESLLKMISKGANPANVDKNLLSKVASVINMPTSSASSTESYNPASSVATYNPAQTKASPQHSSSSTPHHRERKTSGSSSTSPGHSTRHHRPNPIRRRLSTQELTKEPVVIPLVAKQNSNPTMHSAHPDPRLTLSRLLGVRVTPFSASMPRFSKDLILPSPGKMVGLKVTLSSEESKVSKRDPRLGRHKDPRLQRSSDPRLKSRGILKSSSGTPTIESKSSVPAKPSALLTKSSVAIPSLPELDLNLAHINQHSNKENGDSSNTTSTNKQPSYALPNLKLPRLVKAPVASPSRDSKPDASPVRDTSAPPPTIAPYDPRYMSSGSTKQTASSDVPTAPYDPRVLSGNSSSLPAGMEVKKRTIQLPKLTPAPTYKPSPDAAEKPEGDQGDF